MSRFHASKQGTLVPRWMSSGVEIVPETPRFATLDRWLPRVLFLALCVDEILAIFYLYTR